MIYILHFGWIFPIIPTSKDLHCTVQLHKLFMAHRQSHNNCYCTLRVFAWGHRLLEILITLTVVTEMIINSVWFYDDLVVVSSITVSNHILEWIMFSLTISNELILVLAWGQKDRQREYFVFGVFLHLKLLLPLLECPSYVYFFGFIRPFKIMKISIALFLFLMIVLATNNTDFVGLFFETLSVGRWWCWE